MSCPCFGVVGKGNPRTLGFAVVADDQSGLVVHHVSALHGIVMKHVLPEIVMVDGFQCLADPGGVDQRPQAGNVGQVLPN